MKSKLDSYSFTNSVFLCILFSQELTYKIKSFTSDISDREKQRQIFKQAFDLWSGATNLRIKEDRSSADKDVDIHISFESGYHNDAYPFDGQGGTLAHAFYLVIRLQSQKSEVLRILIYTRLKINRK